MNPRLRLAAVVLSALVAARPPSARAWSANGHRAVAIIAQDRLSPDALAGIQAVWGAPVQLADIAPCADDIRHGQSGFTCAGVPLNAEPQSEPWHFVDIPITETPSSPDAYCSGGNCVTAQIEADLKTLQDPSTPQSAKQIALMFLVHFVGDEHQPLHCANEIVNGVNDRGGNLKPIHLSGGSASGQPAMSGLNLHSFWDHQLLPADSSDPAALAKQLEGDLSGKDVSGWLAGDFVPQAAMESFFTAQKVIYPAYHAPNGDRPDAAYVAQMQPIVYDRIERAGVRLAALLERAFPASVPRPVAVEASLAIPDGKTAARVGKALGW